MKNCALLFVVSATLCLLCLFLHCVIVVVLLHGNSDLDSREIKFNHDTLIRLVDFMGATHIVTISELWFGELYTHMIRTIGIERGLLGVDINCQLDNMKWLFVLLRQFSCFLSFLVWFGSFSIFFSPGGRR